MAESYRVTPDIHVLTTSFVVPGFGQLPINAFVLKSTQPVLVDTGYVLERTSYMDALKSVIDPAELEWVWLTHDDPDHTGALRMVLEAAPRAKVITTFLALGKLSLFYALPPERVYLLNPGESIDVGDRKLVAVKPPTFDAPETTGFYDRKSGAFFCADAFGAIMAEAQGHEASAIDPNRLREAQTLWATIDAPWLHTVDRSALAKLLGRVREMAPKLLLSSHLAPAPGAMLERLLTTLAAVPEAKPFVGPNQAELMRMLEAAAPRAK
jgi:glyoxylase-like metal-dependent hydrolase (beta-lactamase superfamily II)